MFDYNLFKRNPTIKHLPYLSIGLDMTNVEKVNDTKIRLRIVPRKAQTKLRDVSVTFT